MLIAASMAANNPRVLLQLAINKVPSLRTSNSETSLDSPMSGILAKLKNNKNKYSFDSFVDRYFWVDTKIKFLRYAKKKKSIKKAKVKGMHLGDITHVKRTAHEKFFIVCKNSYVFPFV